MRTTSTVIGLALSSLLLAGCSSEAPPPEPAKEKEGSAQAALPLSAETPPQSLRISEVFTTWREGATAVTYNEDAVPEDAAIEITTESDESTTDFTLAATGLLPNRDYGAHLHTAVCGADPDDSGPHYQNEVDPEQPSVDPAYANPQNEVWLDFHTNDKGDASSRASVDWQPRSGEANSIVIHAEHTRTDPGHAGVAGARLACVDIPL